MSKIFKIKKRYGWVSWSPALHPTSCPLCLKAFVPKSKNGYAVWDHCHICGQFRGWLDSLCNTAEVWRHKKVASHGIQHLVRDPEWQERLTEYLAKHICGGKAARLHPEDGLTFSGGYFKN